MKTTLEMARENLLYPGVDVGDETIDQLKRFEALVRADEREACAKVCEESTLRFHALWEKFGYPEDQSMSISTSQCAAAIRERGRYD